MLPTCAALRLFSLWLSSRIDCEAPRYTSGREVSRGSRPNTLPCLQIDTNDSTLVAEDFLRRKEKAGKRGEGRETSGATGSEDNARYHLSLDAPVLGFNEATFREREEAEESPGASESSWETTHPIPVATPPRNAFDRCDASFFPHRAISITVCRKATRAIYSNDTALFYFLLKWEFERTFGYRFLNSSLSLFPSLGEDPLHHLRALHRISSSSFHARCVAS